METNKDLLLCENKYFIEKNKLENIVDFNKKIEPNKSKDLKLKTEMIYNPNVLNQVKSFLQQIKVNNPKCVNIEENEDDEDDEDEDEIVKQTNDDNRILNAHKKIQLNLLLYEQDSSSCSEDDEEDFDDVIIDKVNSSVQ
ncbi:hypothetical protein RDWZM_000890 [Blomia tropicalis]|uniref:Uncharacterized protein n=1 Tax=Blomia tropicalis TaxID=40697 RepID=A0A9Q0MAL9_BLOTA|nr:hypothetical protein RDWZM_000890 [Blomia tropicalis]